MSDLEGDAIIYMNRSFLPNHCFVCDELLNQENSTEEHIYPKWYCDIKKGRVIFLIKFNKLEEE